MPLRRLLFLLLCAAPAGLPAQVGESWRGDLRLLARELPTRHPDLFYRLERTAWDSAVASLDRRLPSLSRNQATVALMELVALVNDGHTSINPLFEGGGRFHYYPVAFAEFEEGLFITKAAPSLEDLVGGRVVQVGGRPADSALALAGRTLSHENQWWIRAWAPLRLAIPEVVDGLGLAEPDGSLRLVVERDGQRRTVALRSAGVIEPRGHNPEGGIDRGGWVDMAPGAPPLWQQQPGRPYWVTYRAADRLLYVCYRGVISLPDESNARFWERVFAMADSLPVERLVIDLRENAGGNSFFNRRVVRGLVARPALDRPDRLFVLIGGRTFSAAMNLVEDLEDWTNATLVGSPTGNATVFFGDHAPLVLPASGLTVNVSTLPWYPSNPRDHRDFIPPAYYTPLTAADYRAGRDPALALVLDPAARPTLADRLGRPAATGDSGRLAAALRAWAAEPVNRFRALEGDVNQWGYDLLRAGRGPEAVTVFRANAAVYAGSANAFDSLGEALATLGRREEAIAAYERALAIDASFPPSRAALARLKGAD